MPCRLERSSPSGSSTKAGEPSGILPDTSSGKFQNDPKYVEGQWAPRIKSTSYPHAADSLAAAGFAVAGRHRDDTVIACAADLLPYRPQSSR